MARLRKNYRGRWEFYGGMNPIATIEITSGDVIYVEVDGHDGLEPTRIEFVHDGRGGGDYVSVDAVVERHARGKRSVSLMRWLR